MRCELMHIFRVRTNKKKKIRFTNGVTKCVKKIFPTSLRHQQLELLIKCSMDPFFHVYGFCEMNNRTCVDQLIF